MNDIGATGQAFIDTSFAQLHGFRFIRLLQPRTLTVVDGRVVTSGPITHFVTTQLSLKDESGRVHTETLDLFPTKLGQYPIILGLPWFRKHSPHIRFDKNTVTFDSPHCLQHCSPSHQAVIVSGLDTPFDRPPRLPTSSDQAVNVSSADDFAPDPRPRSLSYHRCRPSPHRAVNVSSIDKSTDLVDNPRNHHPRPRYSYNSRHHLDMADSLRTMNQELSRPEDWVPPTAPDPQKKFAELSTMDISMIGAAPFNTLVQRASYAKNMEIFSISIRDIEKALAPKSTTDPAKKLPTEYHDFLDVFSRADSDILPPHRPYDHKIPLMDEKTPPWGPLYSMSQDELKVLKKYLEENLSKGFIRASSSPAASPVLFARKPGGGLRFCVDYRQLNAMTIKNRYPLPLIKETLERVCKAKIYSKIDIIAAFNRLRMQQGEEWKTAFRTRYGLYEYLVMPFGLANAPSSFQNFINDILHGMLDEFCTAYIDDILIYSNSKKEHQSHVRKVLAALQKAGLQADIDKCEFHVTKISYLGLIISTEGIRMDPKKVEAVQNWETPTCVKDVQAFIGFANFYRRFIRAFSEVVRPMIATVKKNTTFHWTSECQKSFELLKERFTTAPVLAHFDFEKECILETDSSDNVSAGVLSQYGDDGLLHPVAFFSRKHSPQEINYEIYDKELLAIIKSFEEWRPMLEGAGLPVKILTDHRNLQYFMSTKQLSRRQARWSEFLSRFNFVIHYRPGKLGAKPDALTRRSGDLPKEGDGRLQQMVQTVLKPHNLDSAVRKDLVAAPLVIEGEENLDDLTLEQLIDRGYEQDPLPNRVLQLLADGANYSKDLTIADCANVDGRLHYRDRLYVPNYHVLQLRLCRLHHDSPHAGHLGIGNTYELLHRNYYWPNMQGFVKKYVRHCDTCKRSKGSRFKKQGVLQPLAVPDQRWQDISIDFVTGIPTVKGANAICNIVDRLSKERHHIATDKEIDAERLAELFVHHVWKLHGLPRSIISDRGTQFVNDFWKFLCKRLGISVRLSTAWHPETDGQTERLNGVMEQYLRAYVNYLQDDWPDWLPLAEFTGNNTKSETTKVSPFFANKGFHPRMGFEPAEPPPSNIKEVNADAFATRMEEIQKILRDNMLIAQADHERHANQHRGPAPQYKVGDLVWLDTRNLFTKRPSRKLENRHAGKYRVKRIISNHAVELDLPNDLRVHPVFHVNLLEPAATDDPHPGHVQPPGPPIEVDGETEYEVTAIVDSRLFGRNKKLQYRVQWTGYSELNWEDAPNITNATDLLHEFHSRYPNKPGPLA